MSIENKSGKLVALGAAVFLIGGVVLHIFQNKLIKKCLRDIAALVEPNRDP